MEKDVEKILIDHLCKVAGLSPSALARAAGLSASTLTRRTRDVVDVTHDLSMKSLQGIADYLKMPFENIIAHRKNISRAIDEKTEIPSYVELSEHSIKQKNKRSILNQPQVDDTRDLSRVNSDNIIHFENSDIPFYGYVHGSSEAVMLNVDSEVKRVPRHPDQSGFKDSFAMRVTGDSMDPRYRDGERVYAVRNLLPAKNQDCIIEMHNNDGFLKTYEKKTDKEIICRQLNPAKIWKKSITEIKAIHLVVGASKG